jgi:hypothetical protein
LDRHFKRVDEHAASCPRCQARERFLRDRFPPMPEAPRSPMLSGFMAWDRFLARFPAWTRPVINGAAIVTALVAIRVVLVLPRHASWTMLYALVIGAALGAAGGLTYSALRPYIAAGGVRKVIAYLLVLATYLALPAAVGAYGDQMGFSPIGALVVLGIVGVVVALWQLGRRRTN